MEIADKGVYPAECTVSAKALRYKLAWRGAGMASARLRGRR